MVLISSSTRHEGRGIKARKRNFRVGAGPKKWRIRFAALSARTIRGIGSPASSERQRAWRNIASLLDERSVPRPSNSLDPACPQGGRSTAGCRHSRRPSHTRCDPGSSASKAAPFAHYAACLDSSLGGSSQSRLSPQAVQSWRPAYVGQVSNPRRSVRVSLRQIQASGSARSLFGDSKIFSL
jgi:hypothetical protein